MKIRHGFVSNSSSSSFTMSAGALSALQLHALIHHIEFARMLRFDNPSDFDEWGISVKDGIVEGYTTMDNFDMQRFMDLIGIDDSKVEWNGENGDY
jgi:hypothetical protein